MIDIEPKLLHTNSMLVTNMTIAAVSAERLLPIQVKTTFAGKGDPGYWLTPCKLTPATLLEPKIDFIGIPLGMISLSWHCLLKDKESLPLATKRGGILTPMTALGDVLLARLKTNGQVQIEISVVSSSKSSKSRKRSVLAGRILEKSCVLDIRILK
jgi:hypothetical protein